MDNSTLCHITQQKYGGYVQLSTLLLQHPVRKLDKQQQMLRVRSYSEVIMHVNGDRACTIEEKILKIGRVLLWNLGRMVNLFWFVIEDHIMECISVNFKRERYWDTGIREKASRQEVEGWCSKIYMLDWWEEPCGRCFDQERSIYRNVDGSTHTGLLLAISKESWNIGCLSV